MAFLSSFVSYLILFIIFVVVISAGVFIGITLRKKKNNEKLPEKK